jgi:flagellin
MLAVADGALAEVSSLLSEIESLVAASSSSGGLSPAEIAANQSQIDSAIESIDRIVNTTNFNGKRLLDGSQAIQTGAITANTFDNLRIYSRGNGTSDLTVTASVDSAASAATGTITIAAAGVATSATTELVIAGTEGTTTITLGVGASATNIAAAINNATAITGVTASAAGAGDITLLTNGVGSDEFLSMTVLSGGGLDDASSLATIARDEGVDATVTVNGRQLTADGSTVYYSANGYSFSFDLGTSLDEPGDGQQNFTLNAAGGLTFQLGQNQSTQSTIGISSVGAYALGGGDAGGVLTDLKSGNSLDLANSSANSLKVVRKAIADVAGARGRIGGFQKFEVQTSINNLQATRSALTDARGVIADTDFAVATSELNRQSVLMNSGISLLGLANQQAAQILSLLG